MKFQIMHESNGRIRVRFIQKRMTLEQADLLEAYLQTLKGVSQAAVPVSYTHLRAHETGRNLVCRLLLEKKKTSRKVEVRPKEIATPSEELTATR